MDSGLIVVGLLAVVFTLLVGLAVRKLVIGLYEGEKQKQLEGPDLEAEDRAAEATPAASAPPAAPVDPLAAGLAKTRASFAGRVQALLFGGRALAPEVLDALEEILVTSDIGVHTTGRLIEELKGGLTRKELDSPAAVQTRLKQQIRDILALEPPPLDFAQHKPLVVMVIGVNGAGKTTTIGKLSAQLTRSGKKVVLAAGDTFRAAAVEQLQIWADRSGATLVRGPEGGDPSSVIFEAVQRARAEHADICLCDTAGRLHTKTNLMEELKKVRRVIDKAMPGAPHEVLLVLDATTGQNAIAQAKQFTAAVQVGSIALTKLDGSAKGGVIIAIADALRLPVRYVGVGEGIEDLRDFKAETFVEALFVRDGGLETHRLSEQRAGD